MQTFKWDDKYLTGLPEVDKQHRKLVGLLNECGDFLASNEADKANVLVLLAKLLDYAEYHFREEEQMMLAVGIDTRHLRFHQKEHETFLRQVLNMNAEIRSASEANPGNLLDFLTNWLAYHILGVDQNMARQLAAIAAGTSSDEAFQVEEKKRSLSTEPLLAALTGLFQQLSERNQSLLDVNKNLEARVRERTQALLEANSQLEKLALTDVLTELPNRRHAMSVLRQLWDERDGEKENLLVCMMIDADGFKQINDHYGHESGDVVLKALARELACRIRTDDIVCRLGGDEFLIICTNTPLAGAVHLGKLVRKAVSEMRVRAGIGLWKGSISVGIAARTAEMEDPDALLKAADDSVYMAKHDGRNCVRSIQCVVDS